MLVPRGGILFLSAFLTKENRIFRPLAGNTLNLNIYSQFVKQLFIRKFFIAI